MQKGQILIWIIVGALVIAVAGGAYYLGRSTSPKPSPAPTVTSQTPQPTSSPSPSDASPAPTGAGETANWKTYTNTTFNYSIKYPPEVSLEEKPGGFISTDKQIYVDVRNSDPEQCRGDCPIIQLREEININGLKGKKLAGYIGAVGGSVPQSYQTIVIPHNNSFYNFTVYELKYDEIQPPTRQIGQIPEKEIKLLEKIVSTLKFL